MNNRIFAITLLSLIVLFSTSTLALAHPHEGNILIDEHIHQPQTEYYPIANTIYYNEKTSLFFHAPEDNTLPWAFVEGKIDNHVEGYPVIIQIFKDDDAVHFAQTEVKPDGTYEYKFRVLNVETEKRIFLQKYPLLNYYQEKLDEFCTLEKSAQDSFIEENIPSYQEKIDDIRISNWISTVISWSETGKISEKEFGTFLTYVIQKGVFSYADLQEYYDFDIKEIQEQYCQIPDQNKTIKLFEGEYYVTIFKVVYLDQSNMI